MAHITLESILNEETPSEQAKRLGLTYGGFGGWVNKDRKVVARTIDGKLVKVGNDEEQQPGTDMGKITILVLEDTIVGADNTSKYIQKFNQMIKAVIKKGGEFVMLCNRGSERAVAEFLRANGIKAGLKLVPIVNNDPNKMKDFVKSKIEQGFTNIQFFDTDEHATNAVDSLRATYNKLDIVIDTHLLSKHDREQFPSGKPVEKTESEKQAAEKEEKKKPDAARPQ
jgi:hypothetical protein